MNKPEQKHPIGSTIRFLKRLEGEATGDHPAFLYAEQGEIGEIVSHDAKEGYMVNTKSNPPFGASADEFKIVEPEQQQPIALPVRYDKTKRGDGSPVYYIFDETGAYACSAQRETNAVQIIESLNNAPRLKELEAENGRYKEALEHLQHLVTRLEGTTISVAGSRVGEIVDKALLTQSEDKK